MRNLITIIAVILAIAGCGGAAYMYYQYSVSCSEKAVLIEQNAMLENTINGIGPMTTVYTVTEMSNSKAGGLVDTSTFELMSIPQASVTESMITSSAQLDALKETYYKIALEPGTPLTTDMFMRDPYDTTTYERDIVLKYLPLGLDVGDYVDLRVVMPYGEELIGIAHERVYQIVEDQCIIKVRFDETQLIVWTSMMKDLALWEEYGMYIYATKYVEPGLQKEVQEFYPIREDMTAFVNLDTGIKNKNACINMNLRTNIDERLQLLKLPENTDGSKFNAKASSEAGTIVSGSKFYVEKTGVNDINDTYISEDAYYDMQGEPTVQ